MITEEEKKAIEHLKILRSYCCNKSVDLEIEDDIRDEWAIFICDFQNVENLITKLQEENEKKDKVIDEIIGEIIRIIYYYENYKKCDFEYEITESISETQKNVKQYFYAKVENDE